MNLQTGIALPILPPQLAMRDRAAVAQQAQLPGPDLSLKPISSNSVLFYRGRCSHLHGSIPSPLPLSTRLSRVDELFISFPVP